jgi:Zn-dependent peptidase ImmA (M78 family)
MSRTGIQGFQPARLIQILAARRLTQGALASMVEVSPATISKWRAGTQFPERDALNRLASVVNVAPEWFTRPPMEKLTTLLYRSNASAHVAARAKLEARLEWAQDIVAALGQFVDYPVLNLPTRSFQAPEEITSADIEQAACECRDSWRLGRAAIQDIALAAEGAGIILVREETEIPQIEGLSAWSSALARPFVLLSADKDNGYRSRFDLSHEIGHLILHRQIKQPNDTARHKELELQAHAFAGAFLLPAESFIADVPSYPTLDDLLLLKRRWGVSVGAIVKRLQALKIIDNEDTQLFFKRRSARWGGKSEPGDGDRPPERPRLLRRTTDLLVEQNVMPLTAISRHIGLSDGDIESLSGLQEGYFRGNRTIVELAPLRSGQSAGSSTKPEGEVLQFPRRAKN